MSVTIAALVVAGLQAGAQFLKENKDIVNSFVKENKHMINATLKQSKVIINNIERGKEKKQYEYSQWTETETGLTREYLLRNGKKLTI